MKEKLKALAEKWQALETSWLKVAQGVPVAEADWMRRKGNAFGQCASELLALLEAEDADTGELSRLRSENARLRAVAEAAKALDRIGWDTYCWHADVYLDVVAPTRKRLSALLAELLP